jgi:vacuolar-type H+-ATPase subunit E/Vma4
VIARCIDIEKLAEIADNLEKMIGSIKDDNQRTVEWIREENTARGDRIEKNIAEMRKEIHRGG